MGDLHRIKVNTAINHCALILPFNITTICQFFKSVPGFFNLTLMKFWAR